MPHPETFDKLWTLLDDKKIRLGYYEIIQKNYLILRGGGERVKFYKNKITYFVDDPILIDLWLKAGASNTIS